MGNYVRYAVKVAGPEHIAKTIRFADERNIRLVIRNTGHDYMGRSTGAGGLAIWTHHLKGVQVKDWSDAEYTGKAVKIAAGVEGHEVLQSAAGAGLVLTTGECPTVGVAGGYVQGGGHSPLATAFGLAADQTLEFEVVTAEGRLVTARPSSPEHADLFWALSGSGAGNYGVVVSVTLRAHPDAVTSGAEFAIARPHLDYPAILDAWHAALPDILDAGTMATYSAARDSMVLYSLTGYNRTKTDLEEALAPFIDSLGAMNLTLRPNYTQFGSYHQHYSHYYGPLPAGRFGAAGASLIGGRLLSRDALASIGAAISKTLQSGAMLIGQAMDVSRFRTPARAVLPQWRSAAVMSAYSLPYELAAPFSAMEARQNRITEEIMPVIEAVTPGAGAYINEADFQQSDWQEVFFGSNYNKLLAVKRKYDPKGIFYNPIAVGSERWEIRKGGRMCQTRAPPEV
jgi:FAD/FMN-containing dehydrogenase